MQLCEKVDRIEALSLRSSSVPASSGGSSSSSSKCLPEMSGPVMNMVMLCARLVVIERFASPTHGARKRNSSLVYWGTDQDVEARELLTTKNKSLMENVMTNNLPPYNAVDVRNVYLIN